MRRPAPTCFAAVALLGVLFQRPALAQPKGSGAELTLRDAFLRAAARSEPVAIAEQEIVRAEVGMRAALVPMLPRVSLTGEATVQNPVEYFQNLGQFHGSGSVFQPIFRKGFFSGREAAELSIDAAKASRDRARQQVMLDLTVAFIAVLGGRQAVAVAEAAVQRADTQQAAATARVQAGGALRTTQLQATINLRQAQVLLQRAKRDLAVQEAEFHRLVGIAPPAKLTLPPTPELPTLDKATTLAQQRADLLALKHRAMASREQEDVLGGRKWPTLDLRAGFDVNWPQFAPVPTGLEPTPIPNTVGATAVLTVPLFQGGDEYFAVQSQRVTTENLQLEVRQLEKRIAQELRTAIAELETARNNFELAEEQVKDAQENYGLVATQFKLRTVSFIELAAAQSALTEADNLRSVSQYDRELAAYRLLFAIGALQL